MEKEAAYVAVKQMGIDPPLVAMFFIPRGATLEDLEEGEAMEIYPSILLRVNEAIELADTLEEILVDLARRLEPTP